MPTKLIDNFSGRLTRDNVGDMNSGLAKFATTFGANPFGNLTNLTWFEQPVQIDPTFAVITDVIMAAKVRLESGITYVYAIGHLGRLYKIQVNNPSATNPNYDNPVLLTTLVSNSPTFKYGTSIQFYGATEKIFIGHDIGVTKVNFDGSGETFVGSAGSYTANVPRPSVNFQGKLEFGNGINLVEIDSTELVTTYAKLSPGFPSGTFVRDVEVSPDGNYTQIVVSRIPAPDLTGTTQDTSVLASGDSYLFLWNGTDTGYTSFTTYNSHSLTTNRSFGNYSYTFGYDSSGAAMYESQHKKLTMPSIYSPSFNGVYSSGNMVNFMTPESVFRVNHPTNPITECTLFAYGQYDDEFSVGLYRLFRNLLRSGNQGGSFSSSEITQVPMCLQVSNLFYGSSSYATGYTNNQVGVAKIYFSALTSNTVNGNPAVAFYYFNTYPTGLGTPILGVYESQQETSFKLFRNIVNKKFKATAVRFYVEPLVANNSFLIDLIGSDGNPIPGASYTFTVGTNVNVGDDRVQYSPQMAGTYSIGFRITNLGTVNWTGVKMELDYEEYGQ